MELEGLNVVEMVFNKNKLFDCCPSASLRTSVQRFDVLSGDLTYTVIARIRSIRSNLNMA